MNLISIPKRFATSPKLIDWSSGLTTAIVSLPLALAFGVASGFGPTAGLYGAICVGLASSLFGSSKHLISEPTGPMTVIMTTVFATMIAADPERGPAMALAVVVTAGLFQIMLGVLKLGKFITLMPYSVISGFMSGIGVILIAMQLPTFVGAETPKGGVMGVFMELPTLLGQLRWQELSLGVIALVVILLYPKAWRRKFPPQLLVLIGGTLLAIPFGADIKRIGEITMGLPSIIIPDFNIDLLSGILLDGLVLGILGSIDTLLTSMISDSITNDHHDSNRELVGQGIGNLTSGLLGGLPGAGATMGTVVNIQSGAMSPWSGVIRAGILLVVVLGAAPLLAPVPMAILAAIALKVGLDILDWSFIKRAHRLSKVSTSIMYGVLLLTVFVDLVIAVGIGVFISNLLTINRLSEMQDKDVKACVGPDDDIRTSPREEQILDDNQGNIAMLTLTGAMIFSAAKTISRQQNAFEHAKALVIDLESVPFMGVTVGLAIEKLAFDTLKREGLVYISGAKGKTELQLERMGLLNMEAIRKTENRLEALEKADAELKQIKKEREHFAASLTAQNQVMSVI